VNPRAVRHTVLPLCLVAAVLVAPAATPAYARSDAGPQAADTVAATRPERVSAVTDALARQLAGSLADRATRNRVVSAAAAGPIDLATLEPGSRLSGAAHTANQAVLVAKGLAGARESLLRVRLAHPAMRAALARGEIPLVAAAPNDDTLTSVTAYDHTGAPVVLDATSLPQRPVLVVEVDVAKALPLGIQVLQNTLAARGVGTAATDVTSTGGYWATKVNAVRLSDDEEPWIKGAAEIYSIVGGFGLDGKAKIDIVQMPYLDHDGTTYYPNQLVVHYSAYKYNLADVVMMEDDGDTNYQQLAQSIASALLYIVDGGAYAPLVSAILSAIPSSWWTDDPDYVDSWYTLATSSRGRLNGAAANGWMDLVPYWVSEL
jgi:hypothetical protein